MYIKCFISLTVLTKNMAINCTNEYFEPSVIIDCTCSSMQILVICEPASFAQSRASFQLKQKVI